MSFEEKKNNTNKDLEQFIHTLNEMLPEYGRLLKKVELTDSELQRLGDLEYFLIEVNAKIAQIKKMLDHDLFGLSLDLYYKTKQKAKNGDLAAKKKLDKMRDTFNESLKAETLILWN